MKPLINMNDLRLERRDDLELLVDIYVTYTAPLRTGGHGRYQTSLPGEIHDHLQRGRGGICGDANKPPPLPYDEFINLRIGNARGQGIGQIFDILRFCAVARTFEENLGTTPGKSSVSGVEAWKS